MHPVTCHSGSLHLFLVSGGCELHAHRLCHGPLQRVLELLLVGSQEVDVPLALTRQVVRVARAPAPRCTGASGCF